MIGFFVPLSSPEIFQKFLPLRFIEISFFFQKSYYKPLCRCWLLLHSQNCTLGTRVSLRSQHNESTQRCRFAQGHELALSIVKIENFGTQKITPTKAKKWRKKLFGHYGNLFSPNRPWQKGRSERHHNRCWVNFR